MGGSSPLARGTRGAHRPQGARGAVHPRSRGEHVRPNPDKGGRFGSSPLARGTPTRGRATGQHRRFIPARAGNTFSRVSKPFARSVHPRSRGEHSAGTRRDRRATGSSPLARGTLLTETPAWERRWFIPARAGNTQCSYANGLRDTVHPRSRGEHCARARARCASTGSSPLARGTHR